MNILTRWIRKAPFQYPVPPPPPTAVLQSWFRSSGVVRVFPRGWDAASAAFAPAAIAATWAQIENLLPEKIPSLTHAIIVLSRPGERRLNKVQRDKLWSVFRVPVYEQIVDERGRLLAAECEAHSGLHIVASGFAPGDETVDHTMCGCGRKTPRLKRAESAVSNVVAYAR